MTVQQWSHLAAILITIATSGYLLPLVSSGDSQAASRHWNYWKGRLGVPYFANDTKTTVMATFGHTTYLHCVVGNLGDRQVSWIRTGDIRVLAIGKVRYTQDTRFTPLHEEGNDVWALKIQETRMSDSGLYECQVSYHDDVEKKLKMPVRLIVLDSFSEIQGSSERHVNEGSQLSLFCSIIDISGPPSFVFWYRDGTVVNYSDQGSGVRIVTKTNEADFKISRKNLHEEEAVLVSSLYIDTVKPEDAGKYTCAPSNARNHSVVVHVIKGENLAMQRENEKSAVPVQQNQANKSATWKPRASIFQYCLTMISFWFYFLHVWIVKNRVSNTCTSANNNQRRRKVHKSGGANSNISEKSWGHGPPSPSGSDAPDNSPLFCTGNPSRICNS